MAKKSEIVRKNLTASVRRNLYEVSRHLNKESEKRLGLRLEIPIYVQDPLVAATSPDTGIQTIDIRWEPGLRDGPTSSRFVVVDYDADNEVLTEPVRWHQRTWQFVDQESRAVGPQDPTSRQFHQVNAWATVQRVLEFFEDPRALGRPIPWGFEGNRLTIVPHAGLGENAYYDRHSKSLKFYSFGSLDEPRHTCLSHDIIAHEAGHAVLDGIRPHYFEATSWETSAFHEFIGDLTAILLALHNADVRHHVAETTGGDLGQDELIGAVAEEFGRYVKERKHLRSAHNRLTMADVADSKSVHARSQVLTGAMFDILTGIARGHLDRSEERELAGKRAVTAKQALFWAADSFRRIALQPLDLCPPADIRFIDYARAVLLNDEITNPLDPGGFRPLMREVFHRRGLCQRTAEEHDGGLCDLGYEDLASDLRLIDHDIQSIARSRTSAYYFLNDNRGPLRIPPDRDIVISDLYDTNKYGGRATRLPREIVLQYIWREPVQLQGARYGRLAGQTTSLLCGGTLVFDGRGNVISWFRKPGTRVTQDRAEGQTRRRQLLAFIEDRVAADRLARLDGQGESADPRSPIVVRTVDGMLHLERTPYLCKLEAD